MKPDMCEELLLQENEEFEGTGGRSEENRDLGFRPAFFDQETATAYLSCFADGSPAPFHLLDGLPNEVVVYRSPSGRVLTVKATVVSGFILNGEFYSREDAVNTLRELH